MKTNNGNYKIFRSKHVVFVLRENRTGCKFIALPGTTSDADVERIVKETPQGDWRKVETIRFDSI